MSAYVVVHRPLDIAKLRELAAADLHPSHLMDELASVLHARMVQPDEVLPGLADRVLSRLIGSPDDWAAVRHTLAMASDGDLIYCESEVSGLPAALVAAVTRRRVVVATSIMAPRRLRQRALLKLLAMARSLPLLLTGTSYQAEFLAHWLELDPEEVVNLSVQVDGRFFRPADGSPVRRERPLIAGSGLEQRDYETLAEAVRGRDVDVRVCAVSPNASNRTRLRMPESLPPNMEIEHLAFPDLRRLYQTADLTVLPLLYNEYSAGLTALLEAIACGSPAVITRTPGLAEELIELGLVWGVPPADPAALWSTIEEVLGDPAAARRRRDAALLHFRDHLTSTAYLDRLLCALQRHASGTISPDET